MTSRPRAGRGGLAAVLAAALLLFSGGELRAGVSAVQQRVYGGTHELALGVGYLPLDPYAKGATGGLSWGVQLGQTVAWRVLDLRYAKSWDTSLKEDLLWAGQATLERFASPEALLSSALLLEPFYGRQSLLNRGDVHTALYLLAGGGAISFRNGADERDVQPAVALGGGLRCWLGRSVSLRLEIADWLAFSSWSPEQVLALDLALALHLGGRER